MKTISLILLLFVSFSCTDNSESLAPQSSLIDKVDAGSIVTQQAIKNGRIVIAKTDPQTGELKFQTSQLAKQFKDGGPVKMFMFRKFKADYGFVRIGEDALGNYRAEGFRTTYENGTLSLIVANNAVWYILCTGECGFCTPTSNGQGCNCPDVGSLGDDENVVLTDDDGRDIDSSNIEVEPNQECTFGSSGGLYPTQVIN